MNDNVLLTKSLAFAARIEKLYCYLSKEKREDFISQQIIRSATAIGARTNEALYVSGKSDFISKLQTALKETAETEYWLRLLILSGYLADTEGQSLLSDCLEIKRTIGSALKNNSKSYGR